MMIILDTNTILRCILQDDEDAAALAEGQMAHNEWLIPSEVVAEIVFVLVKVYHLDRKEIAHSISTILRHVNARTPYKSVVETALHYFDKTKLDFVDCLMIGYALVEGYRVFTFDKKLKKHLPE